MAEKVPLNLFKRLTIPLTRNGSKAPIYEVPLNRATIIISAIVNNNTNNKKIFTLSLSGVQEETIPTFSTSTNPRYLDTFSKELYNELQQIPQLQTNLTKLVSGGFTFDIFEKNNYDVIKQLPIEQKDVTNLTVSKIVLSNKDNIVAYADIEDIRTINDEHVLWEFDLPTEVCSLTSFSLGFTSGAQISADFGTGELENEALFNSDFSDWTGWTTGQRNVSGSLGIGPNGWSMGLNITARTNAPSGTYEILQRAVDSSDSQYLSNEFYARLQLNSVYYGVCSIATSLFTPAGSALGGTGALAVQSVVANTERLFGNTLRASFWARASRPTQLFGDFILRSVSPQRPGGVYYYGGIQDQYTIFNITTAWQKYEWTKRIPSYAEFRNQAYNLDTTQTQFLTDPNWGTSLYVYPSTDPTVSLPLSTFGLQFTIRTLLSRWSFFAAGTKITQPELTSLITNSITDGYYDIGGLELSINDKIVLTSSIPSNFTYDLSNETGANLTLSLLETNNSQ